MAQLPPLTEDIGMFQKLIARKTETLVMREKVLSLSGDSFDVTNLAGELVLKIKGRHMTLSGRKSVYDAAGNHLYDIVKEHFHMVHTTYAAEDPHGKRFLTITSGFALVGSKATAQFTTSDGKKDTLLMKGNWFDTGADIVCERNGAVIARIDRKLLSAREVFAGTQTYALVVAPGADMALMVALCVALDEKNNEGKSE